MMNVYSGFDALNDVDFDALMFDLNDDAEFQRDLADEAARDYFENELENDAAMQELTSPEFQTQLHARYQLIAVWDDISSKEEHNNSLANVLAASAIYSEDSTCRHIAIYDWQKKEFVMNWNR